MQKRNDKMVSTMSGDFQRRWEPNFAWANVCAAIQALPALRAFWPMGANHLSAGVNYADDISSDYDLENVNDAQHNYDDLAPYVDFTAASSQYLSYLDDPQFDILGTETNVTPAIRGLTLGGWFWLDVLPGANNPFFIGKLSTVGNQRAYALQTGGIDVCRFIVSVDGTTNPGSYVSVDSAALAISRWYFMVGRFTPSTEIAVFLNNVKTTNAVGVVASIFNSSASLEIGGRTDSAVYIDGRASMCWICAASLSDVIIKSIFYQTCALYGVRP